MKQCKLCVFSHLAAPMADSNAVNEDAVPPAEKIHAEINPQLRRPTLNFIDDLVGSSLDEFSDTYISMQKDMESAFLISGASTLDLNYMILRTECNPSANNIDENDVKKLHKILWDVMAPYFTHLFKRSLPFSQSDESDADRHASDHDAEGVTNMEPNTRKRKIDDERSKTQVSLFVMHMSVRIMQAMHFILQIQQRKTFSAAVRAVFELVLQELKVHPSWKGQIKFTEHDKLIRFLRRFPRTQGVFSTYVGAKLLRQHINRSNAPSTNRKSNDVTFAEQLAANTMWNLLDESGAQILKEFRTAPAVYTRSWEHEYYNIMNETIRQKLAEMDYNAEPIFDNPVEYRPVGGNIRTSPSIDIGTPSVVEPVRRPSNQTTLSMLQTVHSASDFTKEVVRKLQTTETLPDDTGE